MAWIGGLVSKRISCAVKPSKAPPGTHMCSYALVLCPLMLLLLSLFPVPMLLPLPLLLLLLISTDTTAAAALPLAPNSWRWVTVGCVVVLAPSF